MRRSNTATAATGLTREARRSAALNTNGDGARPFRPWSAPLSGAIRPLMPFAACQTTAREEDPPLVRDKHR